MRIPSDIGLWLQETLLQYDGERAGMADFALGTINSIPAYTTSRWQLGVDTIYRALSCDLIGVKPFIGPYDEKSFLRAIRTLSPFDRQEESIALWNGTSIYGTERLSELCGHYFPATGGYDGTLNPPFVEALEQIYAENGVPWSDKPLLPIVPTGAAAAEAPEGRKV